MVLGFLNTELHLAGFNIFVELFSLLLLAFDLLEHIIQGFMDFSASVLRHFLIVGVLEGIGHLRAFVSRAFARKSALLAQSGEDIGDELLWVIFVPLLQDTFGLNERLRDFRSARLLVLLFLSLKLALSCVLVLVLNELIEGAILVVFATRDDTGRELALDVDVVTASAKILLLSEFFTGLLNTSQVSVVCFPETRGNFLECWVVLLLCEDPGEVLL